MITRAPRQRHDGPRGILTRRADVARAVDDKQVPDVVRLLKLVQHRGLGIVAHARRAQLVDRPPLREHFVVRPHNLDPPASSISRPVATMSSAILRSLSEKW